MQLPTCVVLRGAAMTRGTVARVTAWHHRGVDAGAILTEVHARLPTAVAELATAGGLGAHLSLGLAAAHTRWPHAREPDHEFSEYLSDRLVRQTDLASAMPRLRIEDLFLAWWSGLGDPAGIAAFEAAFTDDLQRVLARFPRLPADELRQQLRIKLFVSPARIRDYAGFGFLQNWVRVTAVRSFVDAARALRARRYEDELDEVELLGLPSPGNDPRSATVQAQLGAAIKRAFADAVAALAPRQRTFLRHAYVDRLTLDQIATTYQVHRATVARTLASARTQLAEQTRAGVGSALGVPADELTSAIAALDSQLELSLSRVLRAEDPE